MGDRFSLNGCRKITNCNRSRAAAGLAPMMQLPEGLFYVFSAGYKQTALDRLSTQDNSPKSVLTRTFARRAVAAR